MVKETLVLLKNARKPGYKGTLAEYKAENGYAAFDKVLKMKPEEVTEVVKESGLRGRGGAGFPTGLKWSFMAKDTGKPSYLVCNADEGEPGTFKDRELMMKDPHMFIEGMMIGCYAVGCNHGYVYVRGEFVPSIDSLNNAIQELHKDGLLGKNIKGTGYDLEITVHRGAGAYVCGEETALLDSLEGKRGQPRVKPPFPAVSGFDGCPTSVNNVETLSCLAPIINDGPETFKNNGSENNAGTRIVGISGWVNNPGAYEVKMGTSLKAVIDDLAGGMVEGKKMKGVIPGGSSTPVLLPDELDVMFDFDNMAKAGTMMGSAAVMVIDDSVDIPKLAYRLISFYNHESCGQCTPCREGMAWIRVQLRDLVNGKGDANTIDNIYRVAGNVLGNTLCPLGDAGAMPIRAFIEKFRPEFEAYIS